MSEYPRHPLFLRTSQSIEGDFTVYTIRMARALMLDVPMNLREFEGLFCVDGLILHRNDTLRGLDSIILEPECLPMQLMRLAYVAAFHQEGPYGADEDE